MHTLKQFFHMYPKEAPVRAWIVFVCLWMSLCSLTAQDTAPRIISQPRLQGTFGRDAILQVVAEGSPPPAYQWLKDGIALPGETGAILRFTPLTAEDAGVYCVKLVNRAGALASELVEIPRPPDVRLRSRALHGPGDSLLRLVGDHLDRVDMVLLNGLSAVFQTLSETELEVWLPNGLVNGPIQFRAAGLWLSASPEFDLQLPGGLVVTLPTPPSGSLYPVFTNAMAGVESATWILDGNGILWTKSPAEVGNYSPLQQRQSLQGKKWIAVSSHPKSVQERWLSLSTEGILYDRAGNTSRLERPVVSFATTSTGGIALDQAGAVWTFPTLDNKAGKPQRVTGFGTNLAGLKALSKVIAGANYNFALNRAGQVFRWGINTTSAQLLGFNHIGQAADESLVDWLVDDSDTGCGIRADGVVYPSRVVSIALDKLGLDLDRVEGGIQQLIAGTEGHIGFLARSGLACFPNSPTLGANAVGEYSGSVFRVLERHALARPRPYLGATPRPLLASESPTAPVQVMPAGPGPFQIQWMRNGLPLENETNAVLSQAHRDSIARGEGSVDRYTVRVSNVFGTTESTPLVWIARNPIIQSIQPKQGPPGTVVTVRGSGLKHLTSMTIGERAATFSVVDDTEAQFRVPNGATDGIVRANAYSYRSISGLQFKVTPGGTAAFAWGEPHPELPFSADYVPTNRTDAVAAYAGWRMSALRTASPTLEVWGQTIGHLFLENSTAIASLRYRDVYAYVQAGRARMLPNPNGLPVAGFQPPIFTGVIALAGSADVFFALREDNFIMTWPQTDWATASFGPANNPPFHAIAITAGADFAAALGRDGTVRVWSKLGAAPSIPPQLPPIMDISASRFGLLALDVDGRVWDLTRVNPENRLAKPIKALPWMIRKCVDVEAGDTGGFAQLEDGRRVEWDLGTHKSPTYIEPVEPKAVVAIGSAHVIGLFQNSIQIRHLPQGALSALTGAPMQVHPEILGAVPLRFAWTRQNNGITEPVSSESWLEFASFDESKSGAYTLSIEDNSGLRWSQGLSLVAIPEPQIQLIEPAAPEAPPRVWIKSPLIGQFSFNQFPDSRWRLESAPTIEGPWAKMPFIEENFFGITVTYRLSANSPPDQFFRVVYDPKGL